MNVNLFDSDCKMLEFCCICDRFEILLHSDYKQFLF